MYSELDRFILDYQAVLEILDEYSLYCHYLGYEPQFSVKYTSPLRGKEDFDDRPSFGVFPSKKRSDVEYMWKDQGKGIYGDIFDLVQRLYGLRGRALALAKIKGDFGLAPATIDSVKVVVHQPKPPISFRIRVKSQSMSSQDLTWWERFGWNPALLSYYCVSRIAMYWMTQDQVTPRFPKSPGYAYRLHDRYKLYFPHEKKDFRFRNDLDERYLEGFLQLRYNSNVLIITKSMKDVGMFRKFGIEAVSSRGEHTMVDPAFIELFRSRYEQIATWMDNDEKHKGPVYQQEYGFPMLQVPLSSGEKDPTDYHARYGPERTEHLLLTSIYDTLGIGNVVRSYLP